MATKELMKPVNAPSLFDELLKPWETFFDVPSPRFWNKMTTVPPVNIREFENEYKIELAAPGLTKEDFHIDVQNDRLIISAEKDEEKEMKEEKYTRNEYNYSSFMRSFSLPDGVKNESIEAKYTNGVLRLTLPKKEEFKKQMSMKHISVQ